MCILLFLSLLTLTGHPQCLLSLVFSCKQEFSSFLKWAHSLVAPRVQSVERSLLGAAVPNSRSVHLWCAGVYFCLASIRKWSSSSKINAREAVTVLCLGLQCKISYPSNFPSFLFLCLLLEGMEKMLFFFISPLFCNGSEVGYCIWFCLLSDTY